MNAKTARHLNALLSATMQPLRIQSHDWVLAGDGVHKLRPWLDAEIARLTPAAIEMEIRRAAEERRAHVAAPVIDDVNTTNIMYVLSSSQGVGKILRDLILPGLQVEIARRNTSAIAQYEAYRLACAQGVAVPPA